MINPCQDIAGNASTTIGGSALINFTVVLDHVSPVVWTPQAFTDTVSTAKGDATFCGARTLTFTHSGGPSGNANDLITVQANGDWHVQAASPTYSTGTLTIVLRVTVSHVDPSVYYQDTFDVTINSSCTQQTIAQVFNSPILYTIGETQLLFSTQAGAIE